MYSTPPVLRRAITIIDGYGYGYGYGYRYRYGCDGAGLQTGLRRREDGKP